ncbi:MAG: hypothetical protein GY767_10580 [Shimia sp.]|nr:hypothetical protein [Shimia sp.]
MTIEFGLLKGTTERVVNTQHAPLVALAAHYQQHKTLQPLESVDVGMKTVTYSPASKLQQVGLSILAGCATVSEVNTCLKPDVALARVWGLDQFTDQSMLMRTLDKLTQMNIDQLRVAVTTIWRSHSQTLKHDWRGFLWLDFDLTGLPCSPRAEASTKGYFSGKKTPPDAN